MRSQAISGTSITIILGASILLLLGAKFLTSHNAKTDTEEKIQQSIDRALYFKSDVAEKRFAERNLHLKNVCKDEKLVGLDKYMVENGKRRRPNILYIDEYKLLYCVIPKVGCTNWKKVLLYLSKWVKPEVKRDVEDEKWWSISGNDANNPLNLEHMNFWSLSSEERIKRLITHTKFMVTREPFERILSAYRNKLQTYREDSFGDIAARIHRTYGNDAKKEGATFTEFLKHLVDHNPNSVPKNEHWENYWSLCYPCDIDYDYILKLETIEEDSDWLFDKLEIQNIQYPKGSRTPSNSSLLDSYLKNIPKDLEYAVYKTLLMDYKLFGYETPTFIQN